MSSESPESTHDWGRPRGYDPAQDPAIGDNRRVIVARVFSALIEAGESDAARELREDHPLADQLELSYELCDTHLGGWVPDSRWEGGVRR